MPEEDDRHDAPRDAGWVKATQRANFDNLAEHLGRSPVGRRARFMNFGYEPLPGEPDRLAGRPANLVNPESIRLLHEVVGDDPPASVPLLEVGCGRGGNLGALTDLIPPLPLVGVDLSFGSLAAGLSLPFAPCQADAEQLPLRTGSVGAVLSIESACTYPHIERFYAEVARVLRPGGSFLYADIVATGTLDAVVELLAALGLTVGNPRDISANVLAARARRADRQLAAITSEGGGAWREYLGGEGTYLHELLDSGGARYVIIRGVRQDAGPSRWSEGHLPGLPPEARQAASTIALRCADVLAEPSR